MTRRPAPALFILTFVTYAYFFSGGGWNQNAHFDLARALVERQTLHIDGYRVNTGDISWSPVGGEWHAYINKPPGVSFLGAIPYAAIYAIERAANVPIDAWKWMTINAWLVTVFTSGICAALIAVLVHRYGQRVDVALAVAFGTLVFPYSTLLMAHVAAAMFLLLAYVWLDEHPVLAGMAAGLAGACFLLCIPAALVLFIAAKRRWRFALGGLPFGILLGVYQYLCFGSPFRTSLEMSKNFTEEGLLLGVFRLPSWNALWGLTFGGHRGLFYVSPVLLLAFFGARHMKRRDVLIIASICAIFLLANASFNNWDGGAAFGPRYLLPMIPFLALPLIYVRRRYVLALAAFSFAIQLFATAVGPTPFGSIRELLRADGTSVNQQAVDELVPHQNHPPGSQESTWASFNAGELAFGAGNPLSVLPVALWVIGGSALLMRRARD